MNRSLAGGKHFLKVNGQNIYYNIFYYKKTGTLLLLSDRVCAALAVLGLNTYTRLTSNSQRVLSQTRKLLSECWDESHTPPHLAGMFKCIVGCFLRHLGNVLKVYLERWCKFGRNRTMSRDKNLLWALPSHPTSQASIGGPNEHLQVGTNEPRE